MPTIVLTGGGSGGHITPLLSLAHALKQKNPNCKIVYIGLKGEKLAGLEGRYRVFDEVFYVPAGKFRRYHGRSLLAHLLDIRSLLLNGRDFLRVVRGVTAARKILKRLQPDVVFSKGGYVAVPVGVAAHRLGLPIITHDSDAIPGLANRIIGRWAQIHAVGQPPEHYSYPKESIRFVGIPVDERTRHVTSSDQAAYKKELGVPADAPLLLVAGGGLGSGQINELLLAAAPSLLDSVPSLQIIDIAGAQHQAQLKQEYAALPGAKSKVKIIGFTDEFYKYSAAADVVVGRAGATTLAELAVQRKACLIIPAAQLTGGHQLENVKQLKTHQAAEVLASDVSAAELAESLEKLLKSQDLRQKLAANLGKLAKPQAANALADLILEAAGAGDRS